MRVEDISVEELLSRPVSLSRRQGGTDIRGDWDRVSSKSGHIYLLLPVDHPWVKHLPLQTNRYIKECRYVMQKVLNRRLFSFEKVVHKNGVRTDNNPDNLEIWAPNPRKEHSVHCPTCKCTSSVKRVYPKKGS